MKTSVLMSQIPLSLAERLERVLGGNVSSADEVVVEALGAWLDRQERRSGYIASYGDDLSGIFIIDRDRVIDWADSLSADAR